MYTRETLKKFPPDTIFASGYSYDDELGIYMQGTGDMLKWVAVRGGIDDWAIYVGKYYQSDEEIKNWGQKVPKRIATKLLSGDTDFNDRYRE